MRVFAVVLAVAVLCAALPATAAVDELSIGGRFMWDATVWSDVEETTEGAWEDVDFSNGTETRYARVSLKGKAYEHLNFKVAYDFADGDEVALKDAYMDVVGVPVVGNILVGQFFEPLGLDATMSGKYVSFISGAAVNAFAPGRNAGLMLHGDAVDGALYYQAGLFLDTGDMAEKEGDDDYSMAARVTCLAAGEEKSDRVIHIGGAVCYVVPGDGVRFSSRPEVHLSDRVVDTGRVMNSDRILKFGGEVAGVFGPLHFTGECIAASIAKSNEDAPEEVRGDVWLDGDAGLFGFYASAGFFLTGEHRVYENGLWCRTSPSSNFLEDGGAGAWEVVTRYSRLDLNDEGAGVHGGKMDCLTVGLNWYLHAHARFMFNYVMSSVDDHEGEESGRANAFTMRTQFDF